jgi:hypothetical protein
MNSPGISSLGLVGQAIPRTCLWVMGTLFAAPIGLVTGCGDSSDSSSTGGSAGASTVSVGSSGGGGGGGSTSSVVWGTGGTSALRGSGGTASDVVLGLGGRSTSIGLSSIGGGAQVGGGAPSKSELVALCNQAVCEHLDHLCSRSHSDCATSCAETVDAFRCSSALREYLTCLGNVTSAPCLSDGTVQQQGLCPKEEAAILAPCSQ